jgi:choice-of-anchor B domain-containing protein
MFARLIRISALAALVVAGILVGPSTAVAGHGASTSSVSGFAFGAVGMGVNSATALSSASAQSLECTNGRAGPYRCENVDLESVLPIPQPLGIGNGNDMWGWTDPRTGREYGIVGSSLSTSFVDVTDPENPVLVGHLPTSGTGSNVLWRDVKVDGNFAFIVSEQSGHGMQVFDLKKLRGAAPGTVFSADAVYRGRDDTGQALSNSHNIGIHPETDFAYAVGTNTCDALGTTGENGGLHMIDISSPRRPKFAGCARVTDPPTNNYVHDVECVIYSGPDAEHQGDEICFGFNENVVTIYDVTDKSNPVVLSQRTYPTAAYTHQGWLTADQQFVLFGDELDEGLGAGFPENPEGLDPGDGTVDNTTTYIMRVRNLENPGDPKAHAHETEAIDHNLYIDDGLVYQSNYTAGLRIQDFSQRSLQAGRLNEVGFFDTFPAGDPVDPNQFAGSWSNYAFFESGIVLATAIESGSTTLYVLRPTGEAAGRG